VPVREGLRQDAAIGYHYGTKDDLLTTALSEWGDDLGKALAAAAHPEASPAERFAATWTQELFGRPGDESVGAVYQALIGGLASQWLVDPESTPTGAELRAAVVGIAAGIA
jgi:AcrR family transcriptional regulator